MGWIVGVKVAAGSGEEQEGSLMLKGIHQATALASERGMQPGYLLTGCVQSGSIIAVCRGSLPTMSARGSVLKVRCGSLLRLLACRRP